VELLKEIINIYWKEWIRNNGLEAHLRDGRLIVRAGLIRDKFITRARHWAKTKGKPYAQTKEIKIT
jgi:hypothetical protein